MVKGELMDGNKAVHEAFAELAPRYEQAMDLELGGYLSEGYDEFIDRLLEFAPIQADDLVLDVATGTARIPRELVDRSRARRGIVGLDITPAMLEHAQSSCSVDRYAEGIHLVCASGTAMAFAAGTFDVVICGFGTHHMDVVDMLSEMRRVLKAGGWIVVAEAGAPVFWRAWWGRAFLWLSLHLYGLFSGGARAQAEMEAVSNMHTGDEWHAKLSGAGFTKIEVREERARRAWYPHALAIKALAGQSGPGDSNTGVQGDQNNVASS
jgi:ubiquinone/menaquinone biosynthesis C-methylase UbiE